MPPRPEQQKSEDAVFQEMDGLDGSLQLGVQHPDGKTAQQNQSDRAPDDPVSGVSDHTDQRGQRADRSDDRRCDQIHARAGDALDALASLGQTEWSRR